MFEKFCDYMYYLLTSPFKKVRKTINQWYILFRVLGKRFDDAMESLYKAQEQTMVATCDPELLQIHADDRKLKRYPGETDENFRKRIANYPEVCRLGGTDPGVLLAVRSLGYETPELVKANEMTGRVYFETDGTWNLDGTKLLEAGEIEDRWAEFYIVIKMSVDESHPIATSVLKEHVRKWKYSTAKDNYSFQYRLSIQEPHSFRSTAFDYKWKVFYWNYRRTDGNWNLDGSVLLDSDRSSHPVTIGFRYRGFETFPHLSKQSKETFRADVVEPEEKIYARDNHSQAVHFFNYRKTDGSWLQDGSVLMGSERREHPVRDGYRTSITNKHEIRQIRMHRQHNLFYLDGSVLMDGSRMLDAYEHETIVGYDLHYIDGTWLQDGEIILDGIENQEVY